MLVQPKEHSVWVALPSFLSSSSLSPSCLSTHPFSPPPKKYRSMASQPRRLFLQDSSCSQCIFLPWTLFEGGYLSGDHLGVCTNLTQLLLIFRKYARKLGYSQVHTRRGWRTQHGSELSVTVEGKCQKCTNTSCHNALAYSTLCFLFERDPCILLPGLLAYWFMKEHFLIRWLAIYVRHKMLWSSRILRCLLLVNRIAAGRSHSENRKRRLTHKKIFHFRH